MSNSERHDDDDNDVSPPKQSRDISFQCEYYTKLLYNYIRFFSNKSLSLIYYV